MTLVAIHQPTVLPWLGWFDKLRRADRFIVLDHVQLTKTAGSWTNRVRILVNREPWWLTVPIRRDFSGVRRIDEIEIDESRPWRAKTLETIRLNYRRRAAFDEVFPLLAEIFDHPTSMLAEWNLAAAMKLSDGIGVPSSKFVRSSTLAEEGRSNELLASLVLAVGGTSYLTGDGADSYLDKDVFTGQGLSVVHQQFRHPRYEQVPQRDFVAGLSIIDALFSCGFDGVSKLLASGD